MVVVGGRTCASLWAASEPVALLRLACAAVLASGMGRDCAATACTPRQEIAASSAANPMAAGLLSGVMISLPVCVESRRLKRLLKVMLTLATGMPGHYN